MFCPGSVQQIIDVLRYVDHVRSPRQGEMRAVGLSLIDRTPSMSIPLTHELRIVGEALRRGEPHRIVLGPKSTRLGISEGWYPRLSAQPCSGKRNDAAGLGNDSFGLFDHGDESDSAISGTGDWPGNC